MFRTLIYPSSGACDYAVELPHWSFLFSVRCVLGDLVQHRYYSNLTAQNLQHATNQGKNDQCGNSTAQSQAPDDGYINLWTPNVNYSWRTAPLTSKVAFYIFIQQILSSEYFKHGIYSPFFSLQNAVCFIILTYLVPVFIHILYTGCAKI